MSLVPEKMPGNLFRRLWDNAPIAEDYQNIKTLDDLIDSYIRGSEIGKVGGNEKYTIYGVSGNNLAYECNNCKEFILGAPLVVDDISIRDNVPLSGREGYDVYCRRCGYHLEENTFMIS